MNTIAAFHKLYLEPENKTFSEIMGNGKSYVVPQFQRDYTWDKEHLEELWQYIIQMSETRIQHFMGYLVFQTSDTKQFRVIDGQQRLTTLLLIFLAALKHFKQKVTAGEDSEKNQTRLETYHKGYMGVIDTVTLNTIPKLILNRHNKAHFRDMIHNYDVSRQRNITATNRKLNEAFRFFDSKLSAYKTGEALAEIINNIADGLIFTTITVPDDTTAYLIFESLNNRGIQLSVPDLLKNYLLSTMAADSRFFDRHFDEFEDDWAVILEQLGETKFPKFLRSFVGMEHRLPYRKNLYRVLKQNISSSEEVIPALHAIKNTAPVYAALQNECDPFWNDEYNEAKKYLRVLALFNIKTPFSLLMAAHQKYGPQDFIRILKWIAIISIRYNVICQKVANEQETVYNKIANAIMKGDTFPLDEIKTALSQVYPKDKEFHSAFANKTLPSRQSSKKIHYLLRTIEGHLTQGDVPPETLTVEHILPYSPDSAWQDYFGTVTYNDFIDCLGNMALLPRNQNMGQESYAEKKMLLKSTPYKINQHIASYDSWDADAVLNHQKWLANQAKAIWRIDGLE